MPNPANPTANSASNNPNLAPVSAGSDVSTLALASDFTAWPYCAY